jgi:apolipoprotein N-acyltransferase
MYGVGFLVFAVATVFVSRRLLKRAFIERFIILLFLVVLLAVFLECMAAVRFERPVPPLTLVGVQMEFPAENIIPKMLDHALAKNTNASIFVLSEYTLDGPVPDSLKHWCRDHSRYLIVGGEDPTTNGNYYDTAFVVGTNGEIVFKQAKSVPIQFFKDGLPAREQKLWNSPWGKIGIGICYDLSYARVTDRLVEEGAQLLIVPTMDVEDWGRHEHELHALVAPVRAAEYGIPIFRLASSGISQAVAGGGHVVAQTSIPGVGDILSAQLRLPMRGSLPLDRFLAPFCVIVVAAILILLTTISLRENRLKARADSSK